MDLVEEDYFTCSFQGCGKFFRRKDRLEVHLRTHTGERPYLCHFDGCASSYARLQHLKRHIEKSHTPGNKDQSKVRCPDCNLELANTSCLKKHVFSFHTVQTCSNLYKCPEDGCSESFHKKKQLVVHKLQQHSPHLGEARKCFSCPHEGCGKLFSFPNRLKQHAKTHQGYACDVKGCSQVLPNWSSLRKHKAVDHAPIHSCTVCGAVFKQKCNWMQHIKIHTVSQKSHACPRENCGRLFLYKKNLTQHIREFHDGEAIWKNRPRKQSAKQKKQKVSRKKSLAARLCGFDDHGNESQSRQNCTASDISVNMAISISSNATVDCDSPSAHNSFRDKETCLDGNSSTAHNSFRDKETCLDGNSSTAHNSFRDKETCLDGNSSTAHNRVRDKETCLDGNSSTAHNRVRDKETCLDGNSPSAHNRVRDKETCLDGNSSTAHNRVRDKETCLDGNSSTAHNRVRDKETCLDGNSPSAHNRDKETCLDGNSPTAHNRDKMSCFNGDSPSGHNSFIEQNCIDTKQLQQG